MRVTASLIAVVASHPYLSDTNLTDRLFETRGSSYDHVEEGVQFFFVYL